jgi:hypothetical protein
MSIHAQNVPEASLNSHYFAMTPAYYDIHVACQDFVEFRITRIDVQA